MATKAVTHPWRRTVRSAVQFIVGAGPLLPAIYTAATHHDPAAATGLLGVALGVNAAATRIMALSGVETFLQTWAPWLAANPKP